MGQAKLKQRIAFAPEFVEQWESEDCVNFAAALARITGWLLHVDWWVPSQDPDNIIPLEQCEPLRVYVADNGSGVFDVRGIRSVNDFNVRTIRPLAMRYGAGGIRTRYYSESRLESLPLRFRPDPTRIERAVKAIEANTAYLNLVPKRTHPHIPAADAADYSFGLCAVFAEALCEQTGLEAVALLAVRFKSGWEGLKCSSDGFFHSLVVHSDGMGEDCWGKARVDDIADRYGVAEFRVSRDAHARVVSNLQRTSPELYQAEFAKAEKLIQAYRL